MMSLRYIANLSYGKDSLAMLEIIHRNNLPLTDIITIDIMATPTISAHPPKVHEFMKKADKIIFERYGIEVTHIKAPVSFEELFYKKKLGPRTKYYGAIRGWPPLMGHYCQRDLKINVLRDWLKDVPDYVQYLGIAADEPERLAALDEKKRAPLAEYGITEAMAMDICKQLDLVSPTYDTSHRDGCWFCPFQNTSALRALYHEYPDYWALMLKWDADSPHPMRADRHTLHDYNKRFEMEDASLIPTDRTFRWAMINNNIKEK